MLRRGALQPVHHFFPVWLFTDDKTTRVVMHMLPAADPCYHFVAMHLENANPVVAEHIDPPEGWFLSLGSRQWNKAMSD